MMLMIMLDIRLAIFKCVTFERGRVCLVLRQTLGVEKQDE
jgi:hypothetical protein